ncbi:hypothetical protein Hanom_Chr05g00408751 [Helianthus anomalus]
MRERGRRRGERETHTSEAERRRRSRRRRCFDDRFFRWVRVFRFSFASDRVRLAQWRFGSDSARYESTQSTAAGQLSRLGLAGSGQAARSRRFDS